MGHPGLQGFPGRPAGRALVVGIGLAAWIFVGGLLNLVRLAFPAALDAVVVSGLVACAIDVTALIKARNGKVSSSPPQGGLAAALAWFALLAAGIFVAATQVPPRAFNYHDDFHQYFVPPVKMLETGTLFGSPLSTMGGRTLGGQAFLDGFALAHFPIPYINGVDALFCFLLCLAMLAGVAVRRRLGPAAAILAMGLLAVVNPQQVNVSALYSASALIIALTLLPAAGTTPDRIPFRAAIPAALLYAALAAVKMTFVPFAALHLASVTLFMAGGRRGWRPAARHAGAVAGLSVLFIAPWIALHSPHYLRALLHGAPPIAVDRVTVPPVNPFDPTLLLYGNSFLDYTVLMAAVVLLGAALVAAWLRRGRTDELEASRAPQAAASCLGAALIYGLILIVIGPLHGVPEVVLRYYCPVVIAILPAAFLVAWEILPSLPGAWRSAARPVLAGLALVCMAPFVPEFGARISQALEQGSNLAFRTAASRPAYLAYNRAVLQGDVEEHVRRMQSLVPAGEPLFAWTAAPFYLDFRRNPVVDTDLYGLANRWAFVPEIRYVIWSYRGFGVRSPQACWSMAHEGSNFERPAGAACLEWKERLTALAMKSEVLADDGETVLFRMHSSPPR